MTTIAVEKLVRQNRRAVKLLFPSLAQPQRALLDHLTREFGVSILSGDLLLLDHRWYITNSGLLRIARRRRCRAIHTRPQERLSAPDSRRWVFRATVFLRRTGRAFVGYGDADPTTVAPALSGAEMRIAETRAVNRALRKAYGIGLCSIEELPTPADWTLRPSRPEPKKTSLPRPQNGAGHAPFRDRLRRLIRSYRLDPEGVRLYAAESFGTADLRKPSREIVAEFLSQLERQATHDYDGLVAHLNTLLAIERQPHEVSAVKSA